MKKLLTILITILMLFALAGCDGNESASGSNNSGSLFGGTSLKKVDPSELNYEYVRDNEDYYQVELPLEILPAITNGNCEFGIKLTNTTDKAFETVIFRVEEYDENDECIATEDILSRTLNRLDKGITIYDRIDIEGKHSSKVKNIKILNEFVVLDNDQNNLAGNINYDIQYKPVEVSNPITKETYIENEIELTVTNNTGRKIDNVSFVIFPVNDGAVDYQKIIKFKDAINNGETVTYTSDKESDYTIKDADEYYVSVYVGRSYDK